MPKQQKQRLDELFKKYEETLELLQQQTYDMRQNLNELLNKLTKIENQIQKLQDELIED